MCERGLLCSHAVELVVSPHTHARWAELRDILEPATTTGTTAGLSAGLNQVKRCYGRPPSYVTTVTTDHACV